MHLYFNFSSTNTVNSNTSIDAVKANSFNKWSKNRNICHVYDATNRTWLYQELINFTEFLDCLQILHQLWWQSEYEAFVVKYRNFSCFLCCNFSNSDVMKSNSSTGAVKANLSNKWSKNQILYHAINSNTTFPSFEKFYSSLKAPACKFYNNCIDSQGSTSTCVAKYRIFFFHYVNLVENARF